MTNIRFRGWKWSIYKTSYFKSRQYRNDNNRWVGRNERQYGATEIPQGYCVENIIGKYFINWEVLNIHYLERQLLRFY